MLVAASTASADLVVTHATVSHTYTYFHGNPGGSGTNVVLDSAATGNVFTTFDGKTGLTTDLGPSGGTVRVNTDGNQTSQIVNYQATVAGSFDFEVHGATLSIDTGTRTGSGHLSAHFLLTNLDTSQQWALQVYAPVAPFRPPAVSGDLAMPVGPGSYRLEFQTSTSR